VLGKNLVNAPKMVEDASVISFALSENSKKASSAKIPNIMTSRIICGPPVKVSKGFSVN
jgi:hypothetical protein